MTALLASAVLLVLYVQLKASHICDLYAFAKSLRAAPLYSTSEVHPNVRLFFWDGELASSARGVA